jgi:hypothetical protein
MGLIMRLTMWRPHQSVLVSSRFLAAGTFVLMLWLILSQQPSHPQAATGEALRVSLLEGGIAGATLVILLPVSGIAIGFSESLHSWCSRSLFSPCSKNTHLGQFVLIREIRVKRRSQPTPRGLHTNFTNLHEFQNSSFHSSESQSRQRALLCFLCVLLSSCSIFRLCWVRNPSDH